MNSTFCWTRLIPSKWEDAWLERLNGEKSVLTTLRGSRSARLDVYCSQRKAKSLLKYFGGRISPVKDSQWKATLEGQSSKPISIRGKIVIYGTESAFHAHATQAIALFSPSEMAFGSGSHPTTASCLRMLCDLQPQLPSGEWKLLDLGTGSGILAIAALALGAGGVLGVDFDPMALRVARCNLRRNRGVIKKNQTSRFEAIDLREDFPIGMYKVVCSNIFSELLIATVGRIFQSLEASGWWIFSGILANQMPGVAGAIKEAGFIKPIIRQQGKWITGFTQKPD